GLPGVKAATSTNQVPFVNSSWNSGINLQPDQERPTLNASQYMADDQFIDTFGLKLAAGRVFNSDEYIDFSTLLTPGYDGGYPTAMITRAMAERLFPGEDAVGKTFYVAGNTPTRIVGLV